MPDLLAIPVSLDNIPSPSTPAAPSAAPVATVAERLAAAREVKAKKEAALARERELAELERLELEERFERETGGKLGREFAIVDFSDLGEGHVVVRLGADVLWNTFSASKMDVADKDAFVVPCVVHPSKDQYRTIVNRRAFIADRCCAALATLYGVEDKAKSGK